MNPSAGLALGPGPGGFWDEGKLSCPIVHREPTGWRMWYYGREHAFPGIPPSMNVIPMGRSGTAVSDDGLLWSRVRGPGLLGSVLDPGAPGSFDAFLVGATDVVRDGDRYALLYMGAAGPFGSPDGLRFRIGVAFSEDGVHFTKATGTASGGAVLEGAASVGFPHVLRVDGRWRMYLDDVEGTDPVIAIWESPDLLAWERVGVALRANPDSSAFDGARAAAGHVIAWRGGYLMGYHGHPEGMPTGFRIGFAWSTDGLSWERMRGPLVGGASFQPLFPGSWDFAGIGCPYLVADGDGLRLYHVGFTPDAQPRIGVALSPSGDVHAWSRPGA